MTRARNSKDYRSPSSASTLGSLLGCAVVLVVLALLVWILVVLVGGIFEQVSGVMG